MQKKIIALAVAGLMSGAAFAQSNVTIYGRLDVGYSNLDTSWKTAAGVKNSSDVSTTGTSQGALTTSRIGFKGEEALGNGMKATFNLEYGLVNTAKLGADQGAADLAAPFAQRVGTVGLAGGWGALDLGRQASAIEAAWGVGLVGGQNNAVGTIYSASGVSNTALGTTTAGAAGAVGVVAANQGGRLTDARIDEAITYTSPSFSGFTAKAQYAKGKSDLNALADTAGEANSQSRLGLALNYANGPLNASFGYSKEKTKRADGVGGATTFADPKQWVLSANYNFGVAQAYGLYTKGKSDTAAAAANRLSSLKGWELGVKVPVGAVTLIGSYYDTKEDYSASNVDVDRDGFQLGAMYSFSKRTTAYALYGSADSKAGGASLASAKADQFAVGLRHDF